MKRKPLGVFIARLFRKKRKCDLSHAKIEHLPTPV
jgi:hypothetical protein